MKNILLLVFFQLLVLQSHTQTMRMQWNPSLKSDDKYTRVYGMQTDSNLNTWFMETKGASDPSIVMGFQRDFRAPFNTRDLKVKLGSSDLESFNTAYLFHNNKGGLVISRDNKSTETKVIWNGQIFDEIGNPKGSILPIHNYSHNIHFYSISNNPANDEQLVASSKNLKYHTIVFVHPGSGEQPDHLYVILFDGSFQILHQADIPFPATSTNYIPESVQISNKGEILLFGGYWIRGKERRQSDADVVSAPYHILFPGSLAEVNMGNIQGTTISRQYLFDDQGNLFYAGLAKLNDKDETLNCFVSKISGDDFSLLSSGATALPMSLLNAIDLKKYSIAQYKLNLVNLAAYKGGVALILYSNGFDLTVRFNIVAIMMNANGAISGYCVIPSATVENIRQLRDIGVAVINGQLMIAYNDSRAKVGEIARTRVSMRPVITIIKDDGTFKKQPVPMPPGSSDCLLVGSECAVVSPNGYRLVLAELGFTISFKNLAIGIMNF